MACMKIFCMVLVSVILASNVAQAALNEGYSRGSTGGFGQGGQSGNDGPPQPYSFEYKVQDAESGNDYGQRESSDGNTVQGEYRVLLPDGRRQVVTYTADDANGFNADVQYEGQASPGSPGGFRPGGGAGTPGVYLPPGK